MSAETDFLKKMQGVYDAQNNASQRQLNTLAFEYASTLQQLPALQQELNNALAATADLDATQLLQRFQPVLQSASELLMECELLDDELRNHPEMTKLLQRLTSHYTLATANALTQQIQQKTQEIRQQIKQENLAHEKKAREKALQEKADREEAEKHNAKRERMKREQEQRNLEEARRKKEAQELALREQEELEQKEKNDLIWGQIMLVSVTFLLGLSVHFFHKLVPRVPKKSDVDFFIYYASKAMDFMLMILFDGICMAFAWSAVYLSKSLVVDRVDEMEDGWVTGVMALLFSLAFLYYVTDCNSFRVGLSYCR